MRSKKAAELHEMLLKSSKAELIEIIMNAFKLTYATFPWIELVGKAKIIIIEQKLEENRVKGEELRKRLNLLSQSDAEFLELMLDIRKNNDEYMKLLNKSIKLEKEIYG